MPICFQASWAMARMDLRISLPLLVIQGELQLLSVFFEAAVGVALPAGFGQQLQGAFGSYGTGAMAWL